jgi:hypothetical protein
VDATEVSAQERVGRSFGGRIRGGRLAVESSLGGEDEGRQTNGRREAHVAQTVGLCGYVRCEESGGGTRGARPVYIEDFEGDVEAEEGHPEDPPPPP